MGIHPIAAPGKDVTSDVSACSPEASLQNPEDAVLMAQLQKGNLQALDLRKWLRRRGRELQQSYEGTILAEPAAPGPNPEELAELSALRSYLMRVFESLTERQRETIQLYFFEGYSLLEISQKMGDSFPSIRGLYARALERLRNRLSEDGFPIRRER